MGETEVKPYTEGQEKFGRLFIRLLARVQVLLYRLSQGRIANTFNGGPVALVTMVGRRSGKRRTLPLVYALTSDGGVVLAASQGGMSHHPLWYHNIVAHPEIEVQIGAKRMMMRASVAGVTEEKTLWPKLDKVYPDFSDYRLRAKMNNRKIPLFLAKAHS